MKARKQRKADGGPVRDVYAGGHSNVVKEADAHKRGGRVKHKKDGGKVEGAKSRMRLDRPGRKTGGRVGADSAPLSSAAKTTRRQGEGSDDASDDDRGGGGYKRGGRLSAGERDRLPRTDFALPGKGEGPNGKGAGSYPIPDEKHGRDALARVAQHGSPEEKAKVRRAVHRKFPEIGAH